jgi:hypothetical protein
VIAVDQVFESFLPGASLPVAEAEFVVLDEDVVGEDWVYVRLAPADAAFEVVEVALVAVAFEADTLLSTDRIDEQFAITASVD